MSQLLTWTVEGAERTSWLIGCPWTSYFRIFLSHSFCCSAIRFVVASLEEHLSVRRSVLRSVRPSRFGDNQSKSIFFFQQRKTQERQAEFLSLSIGALSANSFFYLFFTLPSSSISSRTIFFFKMKALPSYSVASYSQWKLWLLKTIRLETSKWMGNFLWTLNNCTIDWNDWLGFFEHSSRRQRNIFRTNGNLKLHLPSWMEMSNINHPAQMEYQTSFTQQLNRCQEEMKSGKNLQFRTSIEFDAV